MMSFIRLSLSRAGGYKFENKSISMVGVGEMLLRATLVEYRKENLHNNCTPWCV